MTVTFGLAHIFHCLTHCEQIHGWGRPGCKLSMCLDGLSLTQRHRCVYEFMFQIFVHEKCKSKQLGYKERMLMNVVFRKVSGVQGIRNG